MDPPELSLIIPTRNERANIAPLLSELQDALAGRRWDVFFVDDSDDGTDAAIAQLAESDARVHLLHRATNVDGLAGAVIAGFGQARGTYLCVLDADLQHPPATIPPLLVEAQERSADIVIASRYRAGGSPTGLDGMLRHVCSRALRLAVHTAFPHRLSNVTDPLAGYFLVRRSLLEGVSLHASGYKILLELLIRCPRPMVYEIPYVFRPRRNGASKSDIREGLRFLRHLAVLFWDCSPCWTRIHARQRTQPD